MKNKDIAEAFKICKKYLYVGNCRHNTPEDKAIYICDALSRAHQKSKITYRQLEEAKSVIMERLDGNMTLIGWLTEMGIPDDQISFKKIQNHRKQWLKLLIKEHSK